MPVRWLLTVCACAALYVGASQVGFALAYVDGAVSTVWVPTGLAFAMLFLGGRRLWPAILIGEFAANLIHGSSASTSLGMGVGDVLEALAGQALLVRAGFRPQMDRVRDVFALLIIALVATPVGAIFGTASFMIFGGLHWPGVWSTWYTWWLGDVTGVLIVTPLVFSFAVGGFGLPHGRRLLEMAAFALVLVPVVALALGAPVELGFLTLPALVWGTLRFGQRGATVANAVVAGGLVIFAEHANNVMHGVSLANRLLLVQDFFAVSAMTTLVLAVQTVERGRSAQAAQESEQAATALATEMAAITRVASAVAKDTPTEELLPLATRAAAEALNFREVLVVRDAGPDHAIVIDGWSSSGHGYAPGAEAPTAALRAAIPVHGIEWGHLVVPDGYGELDGAERERVDNSLARFGRQLGLGISSAESREGLLKRASTDPLTGLANHRTFHERLTEEMERASRYGRPLSVAMIDIDGFKMVNDAVGHVSGDAVLATVAARIVEVMRNEVTVARLGGDEIAAILPECDALTAQEAVERARVAVAAKPIGAAGVVKISAGVCDTEYADTIERIRELADGALYWVKTHGRDQVLRYSPEVVQELSDAERSARRARSQAAVGVRALARAIDAKDPATAQHSEHVAVLVSALARERAWSEERIGLLREAALVHDVGKLAISEEILQRPGKLTPEEYAEVKRHAEIGAQIASEMLETEQVQWIRWHHERADGGGYPDGLTDAELPEGAKLLALADAWDTMTSGRAYSAARSIDDALAECLALAGKQFAPEAVEALTSALEAGVPALHQPQAALRTG